MKLWKLGVILAIIIIILIVIGYLYTQGYLQNFEWQTATMIFAALAAPYKMVMNWLTSDSAKEILEKHKDIRAEEKVHRKDMDAEISEKEKKIALLDKELELVQAKIEVLEERKKKIKPEVEKMSVNELQQEGQDLFGK